MRVDVGAETTLSFGLTVEHEGKEIVAMLEMRGGEWVLSNQDSAWDGKLRSYVGQGRLHWAEALKRALVHMENVVKS